MLLSLRRAADEHDGAPAAGSTHELEPVLHVTYDRRRHRDRHHTASLCVEGALAPREGDRFDVWLRCPNYPGWSSSCERVVVTLTCDVHSVAAAAAARSYAMPDGWQERAPQAFVALWEVLSTPSLAEEALEVDQSHMSLESMRSHGLLQTAAARRGAASDDCASAAAAAAALPAKLAAMIAAAAKAAKAAKGGDEVAEVLQVPAGAMALMRRLATEASEGANVSPAVASRAQRCARVAHATLDAIAGGAAGVEGGREGGRAPAYELLGVVCVHWAEAGEHCAYRWERELEMMLDLASGRQSVLPAAMHLDSLVHRVLAIERRQMAEAALHVAKGSTRIADMHFESFFYAEVHFGLSEQLVARRDPNRLNYAHHALDTAAFEPATVTAALCRAYGPKRTCDAVRHRVLDDTTAAETREKLLEWLGAHVPMGLLPHAPEEERREAWLHSYCHDEAYRM